MVFIPLLYNFKVWEDMEDKKKTQWIKNQSNLIFKTQGTSLRFFKKSLFVVHVLKLYCRNSDTNFHVKFTWNKILREICVNFMCKKFTWNLLLLLNSLEKRSWWVYNVCGLDIGCGWGMEMCDNDFDKLCSLSQKRLIMEISK